MLIVAMPNLAQASNRFPFEDVSIDDYYYEPIKYVYEQGIMNGTGDFQFSPHQLTTRGQLVTVLHRMEGSPRTSAAIFWDVPSGAYYEQAVAWASKNNLVNGYGNGAFGPNDIITREQLLTIVHRYGQLKGMDTKNNTDFRNHADSHAVSPYARDAINWAIHHGLINTKGNQRIEPKKLATRAEIAHVLTQYMKNVEGRNRTRPELGELKQQLKGVWKASGIYKDNYDPKHPDFTIDDDDATKTRANFYDDTYMFYYPNSDQYFEGKYEIASYDGQFLKLNVKEERFYDIDYVESRSDYFFNDTRFSNIRRTEFLGDPVYAMDEHKNYLIEFVDDHRIIVHFNEYKAVNYSYLKDI